MPVVTNIQGTTAHDKVTYSISGAAAGALIEADTIDTLAEKVNQERVRRRRAAISYSVNAGGTVTDALIGGIVDALAVSAGGTNPVYKSSTNSNITFPLPASPGVAASIAVGGTIKASDINAIISTLQAAGQACVCNCNYCTCNCNYCTCNCNYACTCNCNY